MKWEYTLHDVIPWNVPLPKKTIYRYMFSTNPKITNIKYGQWSHSSMAYSKIKCSILAWALTYNLNTLVFYYWPNLKGLRVNYEIIQGLLWKTLSFLRFLATMETMAWPERHYLQNNMATDGHSRHEWEPSRAVEACHRSGLHNTCSCTSAGQKTFYFWHDLMKKFRIRQYIKKNIINPFYWLKEKC